MAVTEQPQAPTAPAVADVRLDHVTKRFDDVVAVDDVSLEIERGNFFALLGPSGCGKTTTLRMIGGFEEPTAGTIYLGDEPVSGRPPYKRDVNTVFQSYALFPHLSLFENVAFGLRRRGVRKSDVRGRVLSILELVGLSGLEKRKPRQLSGGQQQRVALARALVMSPKVLLLDEPLGALDLAVRKQLQIELKTIQADVGVTFVYVTHDQEEALALSDRVAVMNAGRIEQIGTPREIYDRPATEFVAGFIGETNFVRVGDQTVAVRPERMRLLSGSSAGANGVAGRVVATMVIGPALQCVVRTDDNQDLIVRQPRVDGDDDLHSPEEGERVVVGWAGDAALDLGANDKEVYSA
ncbi:MAG: ABC transporter ATP-binding protein [Gaiellaceae bacterium]